MGEPVSLEISTNVQDYPYEKRYYNNLTIKEFKVKLELIVGAEASSIALKLMDNEGKVLADMTDDNKTLKDYKVKSGMRVYACDTSGENQALNDDSMVEKYEMADSAYDQREDSVRAWKKKLMAEKAGNQVQKDDPNVEAIKSLKLGDRCEVAVKGNMARRGVIAFLGETKFKSGLWVGVKYDEPVGKNDGTVEGVRYFNCDPRYGGFARPVDVKCGDYPEMDIDEM